MEPTQDSENSSERTEQDFIKNAEKSYELPAWRMYEIIQLAVETLCASDYYSEKFDYKKMIRGAGVKIKKFSSFTPESLAKIRNISVSRWKNGVCLIFKDHETGEEGRMIAYDDALEEKEVLFIILHEFGHIKLMHTQQSIHGEIEANCFATAMLVFILTERQFHFGNEIVKREGKKFLVQGLVDAITRRRVI